MATLITGIAVEDLLTYLGEYEVAKDVIESFKKHSTTVNKAYKDGRKVYASTNDFTVPAKRKYKKARHNVRRLRKRYALR